MRAILIDWLVDVHNKFKLSQETLFMATNILDRYLEKNQISRHQLQLLGIVSLFLASKFEDIYAPDLKECLFVTENSYSKEEFLLLEGEVLKTIDFNIKLPSPLTFLERYKMLLQYDNRMYFLSRYLIELSLLDCKFLKYTASNLAASALYLSGKILKKEFWNSSLSKESKFSENDVRICSKELCIILQNSPNCYLSSIRKKYAQNEYDGISRIQLERLYNKE